MPLVKSILLAATLLCGLRASAADAPAPPATTITEPAALVAAEKFDRPESFAPKGKDKAGSTVGGWHGGIGTWSIVNGAAYEVQEGPSKNRPNGHEAVCEYITDLGDLILTGEFKLGGSPQVGFVCRDTNNPNLHLGRVVITPDAIWIQKMSGIAKETRKEELTRIEAKTDPNTWHHITVEISGDHYVAHIDDTTLEAHHERFKDRKGRVGFVARGEGAQFRNMAIWSAKPKT